MSVTWWLVVDSVLSLGALAGLVHLRGVQQRRQRNIEIKLAMLARVLERANRAAPKADLTLAEMQALVNFKRRQAQRARREQWQRDDAAGGKGS